MISLKKLLSFTIITLILTGCLVSKTNYKYKVSETKNSLMFQK